MDRKSKILRMARVTADEHVLDSLKIPKYESTKGLDSNEINILLSRWHKLFNENHNDKNVLITPNSKNSIQIEEVSSTEKKYVTRLQVEESKRKLFCESNSEENCNSANINVITSSVDDEADPYEDSGDEYVPDSEDTSENETDNSSDCAVKKITDVIDKRYKTVPHSDSKMISESLNIQGQVPNSGKRITKRIWNKRDRCFFCDADVLKFSRHVLRHHQSEIEVQEILACNVRDKKRKALFTKLRNKGNFSKSVCDENIVPVRKPALGNLEQPTASTYLPCKYCRGFYKKKYLYRHLKKCPHNSDDKTVRINAQSEGQSLFSTYKNNDILRKEVFPIMRADPISFTAKTDPLICAVARRYLKSHRDKQFRLVASRKMRQLAALFLEIKKKIKVKNLLNALDPLHFDVLVDCTKLISRYDAQTDTYGAPSLASHMGTELKDCIDVAYNMSLKKYRTENEDTKKLTTLKTLIVNEWRYEVSTIANNDLQQKKWNKPSLIPLAEDLTLLKAYLLAEGEKCGNALQCNSHDEKAFKTLVEITYVQLILLNRRRVGELQRMTVTAYTTNINNKNSNEFDNCISESEKILMKSFKRVVIRGKRGRGVPVLFTEGIEKNTNLLLQCREHFVQQNNIFLFPNTKSSSSISGSKAVYKHVRLAGAKNAAALTSTKLRKHLATMSQVINLSEQDLEQLANFMGHTSEIHKTYYRLPSDVYQMAKVSKLLLLNEKGEASKYKGKSLDEINIDLDAIEENSSDDNDDENDEKNYTEQDTIDQTNTNRETDVPLSFNNSGSTSQKKKKRILQPWTENQKGVALSYFKKHLKKKIPPKKDECLQLQNENPGLFSNKSWEKIKIFVVNTYNKGK